MNGWEKRRIWGSRLNKPHNINRVSSKEDIKKKKKHAAIFARQSCRCDPTCLACLEHIKQIRLHPFLSPLCKHMPLSLPSLCPKKCLPSLCLCLAILMLSAKNRVREKQLKRKQHGIKNTKQRNINPFPSCHLDLMSTVEIVSGDQKHVERIPKAWWCLLYNVVSQNCLALRVPSSLIMKSQKRKEGRRRRARGQKMKYFASTPSKKPPITVNKKKGGGEGVP